MALEDYKEYLDGCSRCSMCKFIPLEKVTGLAYGNVCPSIAKHNFHAYAAGGRLNVGSALLDGEIDYDENPGGIRDIIYRCQMCGGCDVSCKYGRDMEVLQSLHAIRVRFVEDGELLPEHMPMMESLKKDDNTMLKSKEDRGNWAEGLAVKDITQEKVDVIFHAGCRYSFDEALWSNARSYVKLLQKAGVDVGIAGKNEACCGCRAYEMGYEGELLKYAEHNKELFAAAGAKTIVTACADCFQGFKVLYEKMGIPMNVEILHMTQFLDRLIDEGWLTLSKKIDMTVTYHDPCHLGRLGEPHKHWEGKRLPGPITLWDPPKEFRRGTHGVYETPRNLIRRIDGVNLQEMNRIKEYGWCCGAGGGVTEAFQDYANWTALERIDEAMATGAEALVTACPWCLRTFKDAMSDRGDSMKVYDIVELIEQAV